MQSPTFVETETTLVERCARAAKLSSMDRSCGEALGPHPCLYSPRRQPFCSIRTDF